MSRETPPVAKHTSGEAYRASSLEDAPTAVLKDLGDSVPEVPLSFFLEQVAPVPLIDSAKVKDKLKEMDAFTKSGRWRGYSKDPSKLSGGETVVFKPFQQAIQRVIDACHSISDSQTSRTPFNYVNNPNVAPHSERSNTGRPDGYFVRPKTQHDRSPRDHWDDIFGPAEYKKGFSRADVVDNVRKIIWSLQHIMSSDPRRRFAFGFTIENTSTRIWFCSRTDVFVTKPFDFVKESDTLINIITMLVSADEVALGWDPTIIRGFYDDGKRYFDITVHDKNSGNKTYRTSKILFSYGADAIRGRGTRVFEGNVLKDGGPSGPSVAIKDAWVDYDRKREAAILADFYSKADDADKQLIHQYFLTVLAHGDVTISGKVDHTRELIRRGKDVPDGSRFPLTNLPPLQSTRGLSTGVAPMYYDSALTRVHHLTYQFSDKVHTRIVYKEIVSPIYTVKRLADGLRILQDALRGLQIMHKYGIIHRDISAGNVLEFNGKGKVGDLEFAIEMDDEGSHEIRTGTLDFMAIEVDSQDYLFCPRRETIGPDFTLQATPRLPQFRSNCLHDLESAWWIAVFILFCNRDKSEEEQWLEPETKQADEQLLVVQQMFPRVLGSTSRYKIFSQRNLFFDAVQLLPSRFVKAGSKLNVVRYLLVERYEQAEAGAVIDREAFLGINERILKILDIAIKESDDTPLFSLFEIVKMLRQKRDAAT